MVSKQMKIGCKTCGARCDGKFCIDCYHKYIRKGRDCKTCNKWCPAHKDLCNLCYRRSPKCTSCDNPHDPDLGPLCKTCYVKSLPVCKTEGCEERHGKRIVDRVKMCTKTIAHINPLLEEIVAPLHAKT